METIVERIWWFYQVFGVSHRNEMLNLKGPPREGFGGHREVSGLEVSQDPEESGKDILDDVLESADRTSACC